MHFKKFIALPNYLNQFKKRLYQSLYLIFFKIVIFLDLREKIMSSLLYLREDLVRKVNF